MNLRKRLNKKKKKAKTFPLGYWKVVYTWFACNSCKIKKCTENLPKVHTNTIHASIKKIIPKEIPKIPIQCSYCTECNSTFYDMHKLMKHSRE